MNIAIPLGGQIRMVICSSFVIAKRKDTTHYDLSGESFQLTGVTADQVYVFDDSVVITEGMELTHNLIAQSLPLDRFVSVSAEEALPNAIGLLLRLAVADGRVTDSELLRIQSALEGRLWQPGLDVKVGDVWRKNNGGDCYIFVSKEEIDRFGLTVQGTATTLGGWVAAGWWWLRSPSVGSTTYFWVVASYGTLGSSGNASYAYGVCPCFSI